MELNPALCTDLSEAERAQARRRLLVPIVAIDRGERLDPPDVSIGDATTVMVVEGALGLSSEVDGRQSLEIVPPRCFCRPKEDDPTSFVQSSIFALTNTRIAIVSQSTLVRSARWPSITDRIIGALCERIRAAAAQKTIDRHVRVDRRVLFSLWQLAERCGRRCSEGVEVPVPLTHALLADYVGAARPSVSTALRKLEKAGFVTRANGRGWLLSPDSLDELLASVDRP